jgi:hypothetical protein
MVRSDERVIFAFPSFPFFQSMIKIINQMDSNSEI